jgi:hypothetical protein
MLDAHKTKVPTGPQPKERPIEPLRPSDQRLVERIERESLERYRRLVSDVNKASEREIEKALLKA